MGAQINDLVAMGDIETLYELMSEDEDWMNQLDAAEGLVKLGDARGLEFLLDAERSDDRDAQQVAKEILALPDIVQRRAEIEANERHVLQGKKDAAKKRLREGRKVFRYKIVYMSAGAILFDDPSGDGFDVPALSAYGLEGWEVVNVIPAHKQPSGSARSDDFSGTYFLLKKELSPDDTEELEKI